MTIKGLIDEDFINYKKPCMVIEFPFCTFKCEKECGMRVCQNSALATAKNIHLQVDNLITRYLLNNITSAICFQGLEPLDSWEDVQEFIRKIRKIYNCNDDIVIYTGYYKNEIKDKIEWLSQYDNIIIKYGRYIPNQTPHYDKILGVNLASDNQYAEKSISSSKAHCN